MKRRHPNTTTAKNKPLSKGETSGMMSHHRGGLVVSSISLAFCVMSMSTPLVTGFLPSKPTHNGCYKRIKQNSWRLEQVKVRDVASTFEEDKDDASDGWLSWMSRGRSKGAAGRSKGTTGKVKFREAEELGGVQRSDRYSSRCAKQHVSERRGNMWNRKQ
jgi:hypothetical protein